MPATIIRRTSLPTLAWCIQMHGNSARSLLVSVTIPATCDPPRRPAAPSAPGLVVIPFKDSSQTN